MKLIYVEFVFRNYIIILFIEENVNKIFKKNGFVNNDKMIMILILFGVFIFIFFFCIVCIIYRRGKRCIFYILFCCM